MIEILVAIIAVTALSIWGTNTDRHDSFFKTVICPTTSICGFIALFVYAVSGYTYIASGYKADVINKEFGTTYTQEQVFYSGAIIREIHKLKMIRVEIDTSLTK